jgi:hypothetical protein
MMGAVMFWKGASGGRVGSSGEGLLDEEPMVRGLTVDCLQEGWCEDDRRSMKFRNFLRILGSPISTNYLTLGSDYDRRSEHRST